jgi:NADH:ubiquinone oxidoreductase subunit E
VSQLLKLSSIDDRPKAPSLDEVELRFSEHAVEELGALQAHYPEAKACILPALWMAQREYGGYLSANAIAEVAVRLDRSYAEIEGVATFYSLYNTHHVPGRHKIELCTCLSCFVNEAYSLRDYVKEKLGIEHGETTADGMFTFEEVECLNACDRAPVIQVGDLYFGPVTRAGLDELIDSLRKSAESTTVSYADSVVQVHLGSAESPRK